MQGNIGSSIVATLCVSGLYVAYFWRILKRNKGNKLIECGVLTLMVFFAMIGLTEIPGFPEWAFLMLILLVILLCVSTLFFPAQRIIRAIGRNS